MMPLFYSECEACMAFEERVFTDSWTGKELCLDCLGQILDDITNSPCSEGDNLIQLMVDVLDYDAEEVEVW